MAETKPKNQKPDIETSTHFAAKGDIASDKNAKTNEEAQIKIHTRFVDTLSIIGDHKNFKIHGR